MIMVLGFLLSAVIGFRFITTAVYAGVRWALDVCFDPENASIFLSSGYKPPENR